MTARTVKISALDRHFSRYVRIRDNFTCQRCGKNHYSLSDHGLHASHFIGRANLQTRFDPDNVDSLCYGCHSYFETHKATAYREWKLEQLGTEAFDALIARSQSTRKVDKRALAEVVKNLLRSVNGGKLA